MHYLISLNWRFSNAHLKTNLKKSDKIGHTLKNRTNLGDLSEIGHDSQRWAILTVVNISKNNWITNKLILYLYKANFYFLETTFLSTYHFN